MRVGIRRVLEVLDLHGLRRGAAPATPTTSAAATDPTSSGHCCRCLGLAMISQ
ncbi:hypothetical protein I546_4324 [Mycobacterium kansasii 732]|nr:hypothetical protein I546_4324 [Mycobacterium kansasii 732]